MTTSDSTFWHDLGEKFMSDDPGGDFGYSWQQTTVGDGLKSERVSQAIFRPSSDRAVQLRFERLARQAGDRLDLSGHGDTLQLWLEELLRLHLNDWRNDVRLLGPEVLPDGTRNWYRAGFLARVFRLSAERSMEFEIEAIKGEQRGQGVRNVGDRAVGADANCSSLLRPEQDRPQEDVRERAARRQAVVVPIIKKKRWTRCRLAIEAGVGKNSVYEYLDGTRARISDGNRKAIADALDIKEQELPE